jgi:hypothetical protein
LQQIDFELCAFLTKRKFLANQLNRLKNNLAVAHFAGRLDPVALRQRRRFAQQQPSLSNLLNRICPLAYSFQDLPGVAQGLPLVNPC